MLFIICENLSFEIQLINSILQLFYFLQKKTEGVKRVLSNFRYAAKKSQGKADFIAIGGKTASDLVEELEIESYPAYFSFRHGRLVRQLENTSTAPQLYYYCKNVTNARYKYVRHENEIKSIIRSANSTLLIAMDSIDARIDRHIAVVIAKFVNKIQFVAVATKELALGFGVQKFPSFSILRIHDNKVITYPDDSKKISLKSLTDFVENNYQSKYDVMTSFYQFQTGIHFVGLLDFDNQTQLEIGREILDKIGADNPKGFLIHYADRFSVFHNLTVMNLGNYSSPLFGFFKYEEFSWRKWIFEGSLSPNAVAVFVSDFLRGKGHETIISSPVSQKSKKKL